MTFQKTTTVALLAIVAIVGIPAAFAEIQNNGFGGQILIDAASEMENGFAKYKTKMHEIITQVNTNTADIAALQSNSQGPQGPQGEVGPQGLAGINGTDGIDGINGVDGTNGTDGADGAIGPQGPAGVAEIGNNFLLSKIKQGIVYADFQNAPQEVTVDNFNAMPDQFIPVTVDSHHGIYEISEHDLGFQQTTTLVDNIVAPVDVTIEIWYFTDSLNPVKTVLSSCIVNSGELMSVCNADNLLVPGNAELGTTFTVNQQLPSDPAITYESFVVNTVFTGSITN